MAHRRMAFLLTALCLVSFLVRQVMFGLFSRIGSELGLTHSELGMLGTANLFAMALASVVAGPIADRVGARRVIVFGAGLWSVATFASALAASYPALLLCRATVGVGQGAFLPAALAMLCASTPRAHHGRVLGTYYQWGMTLGSAFGLAAGSLIGPHVGWRSALWIVGAPGAFLAVAALRLLPDTAGGRDELLPTRAPLLRPAFLLTTLGGVFGTFAAGSIVAFAPTVVARELPVPSGAVGAAMAAVALVGGVAGVRLGGVLGDSL